jgi:N6-adenosine-specific RNA methylase IME4
MTVEEIAALPIPDLADDSGCHLYLWVTQKFLPDGLELVKQWGFNYQCLMTWRKNVGFTPFSWMYDTEHVIFARRGNLPLARLGLRLSFDAPIQGHSVKPDIFYDERVIPASPGPRLDMFARRSRDGFDSWGNEVENGKLSTIEGMVG